MCHHTCPTWLCSLGVTQDPLHSVPWALWPQVPRGRKHNEKMWQCSLPPTQTRESLSLLCRRTPGLRCWWHKVWAQPWASRNKSSCTQLTPFLLSISQKLWGSMISLHCQGAAQTPKSHAPIPQAGISTTFIWIQMSLSIWLLWDTEQCGQCLHTSCQDCSWSSLDHLQAHLPEKHWKKTRNIFNVVWYLRKDHLAWRNTKRLN